jgi:hypothetical protein
MDTVSEAGRRVHNLPIPERFLPLIHRTLADAYAAEAAPEGTAPSVPPSESSSAMVWTKEEVVRAYREATPALRTAFDHLADHPEPEQVKSLDLARVVYPEDNDIDAESRLYGVLGGFGTKATQRYGKKKWFFDAYRERMPDGSAGYMIYVISVEKATWLREASGRE